MICVVPVLTASLQQFRCFHLRHHAGSQMGKHQLPLGGLQALSVATAMTWSSFCGRTTALPALYTGLEGRRAGRRSGLQLRFQKQTTVWGEKGHFFPRHELQGKPPSVKRELLHPSSHHSTPSTALQSCSVAFCSQWQQTGPFYVTFDFCLDLDLPSPITTTTNLNSTGFK